MHNGNNRASLVQAVYQLFGLNLVSEYPFIGRMNNKANTINLAPSPVLHFTCNQNPPFTAEWENGKLIYSYRYRTSDGDLWDRLYLFDTYAVWQFAWGADFYIRDEQIDCHLRNQNYQSLVEHFLVGAVLAYWLEREGFPALHASAVTINNQAAAFTSHSGNGKSTLAAAMLQAGAALLTDDILPIENQKGEYWGRSGLPQVNLWPDQAAYFLDNTNEEFEKVVPDMPKKRAPVEALKNGAFCPEDRSLACIYIPRKSDQPSSRTDIEIVPVLPAEAVIELVRYSFIPANICEKLGWQAHRLDFFARLVEQVPVRRLLYPAGFEHLPQVTEAVLEDLKKLPHQAAT